MTTTFELKVDNEKHLQLTGEHDRMDPYFWNTLRKALIVLTTIAAMVGAFYFVNSIMDRRPNKRETVNRPDREAQTLMEELLELNNRQNDDLTSRLLILDRQISLAEQLVDLNASEKFNNTAVTEKLSAIINRESVQLELNGKVSDPSRLETIAREYVDSELVLASSQSQILLTVAEIAKHLNDESLSPELQSNAQRQIRSLADFEGDLHMVADGILTWLRSLNEKYDSELITPFFKTFVDTFGGHESNQIQQLVASVQGNFENSEIEFEDIKGAVPGTREMRVTALIEQVRFAIANAQTEDHAEIFMAISRANDLLSVSMVEDAKTIHSLLADFDAGSKAAEFKSQMQDLNQNIGLFAAPLDLRGVTDIDNEPVTFLSQQAKFRLLFFTKPDASEKPLTHIKRLIDILGPAIKNDSLEIAVVSVGPSSGNEDQAKKREYAENTTFWRTWFLNTESEDGQRFLDRTSLGKLPFAILMDRENNVVLLGPRPRIIQEFVFAVDSE